MKAPEYKRQVSDSGPERFRQQAPSAAGFARAAAVTAEGAASVGRALAGAGNAAFRISEENDKRTAAAAVNDYVERSNAYLYDPDKGYRRVQGEGVRGLAGRVGQDMGRMRSEVSGKLSRNQARLFEEAVRDFDIGVNRQVSVYEGETMAAWHKDQGEKLAANGAVAWANDPGMSPEALSATFIMPATIAVFGDQGAEVNFKNAQTVMSTMIAKTALLKAESDPLAAEAFFAEHVSDMEPAEAEALRLKVEKAALPVRAQAEAEALLAKHGVDGLSSAIAEVRESYKGKDEDVYLGYVNSLYSDVRQAQHAELESAKLEVQKALYGGGSHSKVAGIIASYSEKFKGYGTQGEAWALGLKVDNDRVHGTGIFAPKPSEALTRVPFTRAEAVRQLVHFNPEFANLPKEEQERLVRHRLGISEEQHSAYFTQLGEAKLRGMSNADLNKAAAMGYITYDEVRQIVEYDKNISPGNKDYLKTKEKNIYLFLKNHGGGIFGGTQNPARNTAVFYFREECRKLDPAAPDFYKQADEAGRRAMLRAIEEKHRSGMPLIDEGWIWDSDTELGTLKKTVNGLKIKETERDVPPRPWAAPPQENKPDNLPKGKKEVRDELDEIVRRNPKAD